MSQEHKHTIETQQGETVSFHSDEIYVEMMTGLGSIVMNGIMPKKMEAGLKLAYMDSGAVKSHYLYINGIEITDGQNHNPMAGI